MAMLSCLIFGSSRAGFGAESPLRWILSLLMNEPALITAGEAAGGISTTAALVLALVIHFLFAIVLARVFLILIQRLRKLYAWLAGAAYGVATWAIMTFVVLRVLNDVMYTRLQLIPLTFLVAHLAYGTTLGLYCTAKRPHPDG